MFKASRAGPGIVVSPDLSESLRSHQDFEKDAAKHYPKSVKFFGTIADRFASKNTSIENVREVEQCSQPRRVQNVNFHAVGFHRTSVTE